MVGALFKSRAGGKTSSEALGSAVFRSAVRWTGGGAVGVGSASNVLRLEAALCCTFFVISGATATSFCSSVNSGGRSCFI